LIGFLQGTILMIHKDTIILLVGGVGYEINLPLRTLQLLQEAQVIKFHIYTHVREDQLRLFGFETDREKGLFLNLLEVSGIGPKTAMGILSQNSPETIETAIAKADVTFFTKIKGVGKKAAQKIIIELKNKVGSLKDLDLSQETSNYSQDVLNALMSFGFLRRDIIQILKDLDPQLSEEETIKQALRLLGK